MSKQTSAEDDADAPVWPPAALSRRSMGLAVRRGLAGRCPNCGRGRLFGSYLKQVERCQACGESFAHISADDGPAWLTILIVGHLIVAAVLTIDGWAGWPMWVSMTFYPLLAVALALALLPVAKGVFIGAIWAGEASGQTSA